MAFSFKSLIPSFGKKNQTVTLQQHSTTLLKQIGDFFSYGIGQKGANQYVKAFGSNPLVYMIINRIAFTSGSINRVANDKNGKRLENSQLLDLINNPNPSQGRIELYETIGQYVNATGNAYIRIQGVGAKELIVLPSNKVEIKVDNLGLVTGYELTRIDGSKITIPAEEILHIRTSNIVNIDNTDGYYGLSPLQAAWLIVRSSEEIFNAEASIFKNRGIIGILTNETDVPMMPKDRERLQDQFNDEVGGSDRFNSIKISNTKLKYIQTGMSPSDLKLLDGILNKLRLLCSVYGLNSVLFNDQVSSTYNNQDAAAKDAYINTYIPLANKIDRELSRFLNTNLGTDEYITIDTDDIEILKGINKEHTESLSIQLEDGVISIEEYREALNRDIKN